MTTCQDMFFLVKFNGGVTYLKHGGKFNQTTNLNCIYSFWNCSSFHQKEHSVNLSPLNRSAMSSVSEPGPPP